MKVIFIGLLAFLLINYNEALSCYSCATKGCGGRREECGNRLINPVCGIIESSNFYVKGCFSEHVCKLYQTSPGDRATCCTTDYCNRFP